MSKILDLILQQEEYHKSVIPLIASENVVSDQVKKALISDLSHRYAEGLPGERFYPGTQIIDEIEVEVQELMKSLFHADYADVRPLSGTQANLAVMTAFTFPGDTILRLGTAAGGHISVGSTRLGGGAGFVRCLDSVPFAFDEDRMNIDVDETKEIVKGLHRVDKTPKLAFFGASLFLFPHPVKELADFLHGYGIIVCYDAAHVAGLIAGGRFQDPFSEGVDIMTMSTHKTFFGPQHGAILCKEEFKEEIQRGIFPAVVSNHHLGAVAGVGLTAEELIANGALYAHNVVVNARMLGTYLVKAGLDVLCSKLGCTESHIILLNVAGIGGLRAEENLLKNNILANKNLLPWDKRFNRTVKDPSGIRIGVQELTRLGLTSTDIPTLASIITSALGGEDVLKEVKDFRSKFRTIKFTGED